MASAAVMAGIGAGTSALGGIVGALGSVYQGGAQSNMYKYQAGVAQINQQIALRNRDYAMATGEVDAQESGLKTREVVGQETAAQGASGLDVKGADATAVRTSQIAVGEQDEVIIRSNAQRKAYGFEVEAAQNEAQSKLDMMAASTSRTAGDIGAITSLLGASSSVADKWYKYSANFGSSNPTSPGPTGDIGDFFGG